MPPTTTHPTTRQPTPTNVALLRGINVGKAKRVAMADLRAVFVDLGFTDVRTVLQSGNVVFTGAAGPNSAERIETALHERTGVRAAVLVLSRDDLRAVAAANPLADVATDPARLLVTFLPGPVALDRVERPSPDELAPEILHLGERAVYQWIPEGILATRVPTSFWKQLPASATGRNWRTVQRLLELVG